MKILIIGSKGFIGSHALLHFKSIGHVVYGCDVMVDYNEQHYFQVDATNSNFDEIFESVKFDVCLNCSGAASVPDSFVHPYRDFSLNVQNVYCLLEAIRKHNSQCKFVNLSSAAVYGNPPVLPIAEPMPAKPLSPYGLHKYYAEQVCQEFYLHFGVPTCSLRIFSAYGPGLKKQLFWDWFQKLKQSTHLTLFGTGRESRDFIFIEDIMCALNCVITNAPFQADLINVGNGKEIFIEEAIEIFRNESGVDFTFSFSNEVRKGDPINWKADNSILIALKYQQQISFSEGIKRYVKWVKGEK